MSATAEDLIKKQRLENQRTRRANSKKQRVEREKIEQASPGTTVEPSEEFSLKMDVTEAIERPKQTFKERVLDKLKNGDTEEKSKVTPKAAKDHIDKSYSLLSSVLPLTLSGILALYSEKLFSDPFKACAPSKEEVGTILLPIFSVIARHVEIEGKASQDAIDLGSALLAAIVVSTRMLFTAEEIRRSNNVRQAGNVTELHATRSDNSRGSTGPVSQEPVSGIVGDGTGPNAAEAYWNASRNVSTGNGDAATGSTGPGLTEAERVADLLRRDTKGRRQMGLAPREL